MKKGKVKKAKLFTWYYLVLVLIASYFIFNYFNNLIDPEDLYFHPIVFPIITTLMIDLFLCSIGFFIIWTKPILYKNTLNAKRFAYHYDRCITAFENMDYEKVYDTYIKRFKNDKEHKYLTEKLIFAYNIIRNKKQ